MQGDFTDRVNSELVVNGDFIPFRDALESVYRVDQRSMGEIEKVFLPLWKRQMPVLKRWLWTSMLARKQMVSVLARRSGTGIQQTLAREDLSATVSSVAEKQSRLQPWQSRRLISPKRALLAKAEDGRYAVS